MSKAEKAIIVFIKNPELGKVKTRLAKTVGAPKALKIYKSLMAHTRAIALSVKAKRLLFYSDWINDEDEWPSASFNKYLQADGDLGLRITQAFQSAAEKAEKLIIIGSDCPQLSADIIEDAFAALDEHDFVIGPALDGGYYLLGMNTFEPALFQDIHWSSATVKAETVAKINGLGKTVCELIPLSDIDFEEDWEKYGWPIA